MFEKFNIDELYYCCVDDIIPLGMTNCGGAISIEYSNQSTYNTIVYLKNGKYYDINNLGRVMNIIRCPQKEFPIISKDNHLYLINDETLVPCRIDIPNEYSVLQRLPFGKKKFIK